MPSPLTPIRPLLLLLLLSVTACATAPSVPEEREIPPILAQDEIFRPYVKVGTVEVSRKRLGHVDDLTAEADEWAYDALGEEAARMDADAVTLPELRAEKRIYIIFPVTEIRAKGVAIKFR